MNHDNDNHGGHEASPASPPPLLDNPTVTIYFDGLIFSTFDEEKRLYQTAVLTQAEGHHLKLEVRHRGEKDLIFPTNELPWDSSHPVVKNLAPFWLFVDSGNGINEEEFSTRLHLPAPGEKDEQSFDRIFNFETFHQHPCNPKPGTFAEFNFPQGVCYSADNVNAKLKTLAAGLPAIKAVEKENLDVSTLSAIDIDAVSSEESEKHVVLVNKDGQEFFRFPLQAGKHLEIKLLNVPIPESEEEEEEEEHPHPGHSAEPGHAHPVGHLHDPEHHFLQFYELFDLKEGEERFLIALPQPPSEQSPPCVSTTGGPKSGISA